MLSDTIDDPMISVRRTPYEEAVVFGFTHAFTPAPKL
jgi:hypothetical protein